MALKIKNQPTWVSSVPMKMRRIRVRSLLAGCISCLRCEQTSGLTCRSSPFASPRTAVLSARLSSRSAGRPILSSLFYYSYSCYCYRGCYFFIPQQPGGRQQQICLTESSLCIFISYLEPIFGASPFRSWPHLFIAATDCGEHWAEGARTVSDTHAINLHSDIAKSLPPRLKLAV